jgi:hypothetical protein
LNRDWLLIGGGSSSIKIRIDSLIIRREAFVFIRGFGDFVFFHLDFNIGSFKAFKIIII